VKKNLFSAGSDGKVTVHQDIELELQKRGAKGIHQIQILQ
jgi:hypothetical protein